MISHLARTRPRGQTLFHLLLALALVGCARTAVQLPAASQGSPSPGPIYLKLALYMDDDFRQYTYHERNFQIPVGELLFQKVPATLGTVFSEVQVVPDPAHLDPGGGKYKAILRPRLRFVTYHPFFRERRTLLEPGGRVRIYSAWNLSDRSGREIGLPKPSQVRRDDRETIAQRRDLRAPHRPVHWEPMDEDDRWATTVLVVADPDASDRDLHVLIIAHWPIGGRPARATVGTAGREFAPSGRLPCPDRVAVRHDAACAVAADARRRVVDGEH